MDSKQISKNILYFLGWIALNTCSLIVKITPRSALYAFARRASYLGYKFNRKQREIALESLNLAFGKEKTPQEIQQIARDCFTFIAKASLELMFLMDRPALLKERVSMEGRENLDQALVPGRGAILVSAHFGNFPLMMARLSLEGYKVSGIMRAMRDARIEKLFLEKRKRLNIITIYSQPRKACVDNSIRVLREGGLLFIPIDQHFGSGGVMVDFFGRKAATATGPVILAQRTKSSILPCFVVRQKDDTHKIIFEKPLVLEEGASAEETVVINIQKLTGIIESYIRKYPAEWGWVHRRWKGEMKPVAA